MGAHENVLLNAHALDGEVYYTFEDLVHFEHLEDYRMMYGIQNGTVTHIELTYFTDPE